MNIVNVILDIPLWQTFSYSCNQQLAVGTRVLIDFNNQFKVGYVLENNVDIKTLNFPLEKLKSISEVSDLEYEIPSDILKLIKFTSNYYHHPLGETLFTAIPVFLRKTRPIKFEYTKPISYKLLNNQFTSKSKKIILLIDTLKLNNLSLSQVRQILGTTYKKIITELLAQQVIAIDETPQKLIVSNKLALNHEQQSIIKVLSTKLNSFHPALLYGITGSGKTEIYLNLIENVILDDKQVLVLIPEINLTPQLLNRFKSRFPNANIITLHSGITDKQRLIGWLSSKYADADIVIGTRSAIFTPFNKLGLIIIDEEHDHSFKQNDNLRYHARDLAVWVTNYYKIPIIMGSATPSIESLYNYKLGKYTLYKLTERAVEAAQLPQIKLIDINRYPVNNAGISHIALESIKNCLARNEMCLIYINRRGYAPLITCYDCSWVSHCLHCATNLVYHTSTKQLKCHHCGYQTAVPQSCPKCNNFYLHTIGHGTQKLEEFLHNELPNHNILRIDRDTTSGKSAWENIYEQVKAAKVDILVGTQMLAKGHDFHNLTLVIGLNIDNGLYSYDFRSSENLFALLTQVAGRAGRGATPGTVLLQTNYPLHPLFSYLTQHDFSGFINYTMLERKELDLPPYTYYALIKLTCDTAEQLKAELQQLHEIAAKNKYGFKLIQLFPAVVAVLSKINNKFRGQMLISSTNRKELHSYLGKLVIELKLLKSTWHIDVDPFEL